MNVVYVVRYKNHIVFVGQSAKAHDVARWLATEKWLKWEAQDAEGLGHRINYFGKNSKAGDEAELSVERMEIDDTSKAWEVFRLIHP